MFRCSLAKHSIQECSNLLAWAILWMAQLIIGWTRGFKLKTKFKTRLAFWFIDKVLCYFLITSDAVVSFFEWRSKGFIGLCVIILPSFISLVLLRFIVCWIFLNLVIPWFKVIENIWLYKLDRKAPIHA